MHEYYTGKTQGWDSRNVWYCIFHTYHHTQTHYGQEALKFPTLYVIVKGLSQVIYMPKAKHYTER